MSLTHECDMNADAELYHGVARRTVGFSEVQRPWGQRAYELLLVWIGPESGVAPIDESA